MQALSDYVHYPRENIAPFTDEPTANFALTPFHTATPFTFDERYLTVLVPRSESVLLLQREVYENIQLGDFTALGPHLDRLVGVGLLIPADVDETEWHRAQIDVRTLFDDLFHLELSVNQGCNFRCVYCYELGTEFPNKVMSSQTILEIRDWALAKLAEENRYLARFKVTLIGGEPLINEETVYESLEIMKSLAEAHGLVFEAQVITNGQRLTRAVAQRLRDLGVTNVQVTIDGDEKTHNERRFTLGGQGTFTRIIENLNAMHDLIPIDVRMNVDLHNVPSIPAFLDAIERQPFLSGVNALVFAHVHKTLDKNDFIENNSMSESYEVTLYKALHQEIITRNLGGPGLAYVPSGGFGCPFFSDNAFHVEVNGNLNKCSLVAGRDEFSIGHIRDPGAIILPMVNAATPSEQPYDWTEYKYAHECLDEQCPYYAMCHGGCGFESLTHEGTTHARHCPKHLFETAVQDWATAVAFDAHASSEERSAYAASAKPWPLTPKIEVHQ